MPGLFLPQGIPLGFIYYPASSTINLHGDFHIVLFAVSVKTAAGIQFDRYIVLRLKGQLDFLGAYGREIVNDLPLCFPAMALMLKVPVDHESTQSMFLFCMIHLKHRKTVHRNRGILGYRLRHIPVYISLRQ